MGENKELIKSIEQLTGARDVILRNINSNPEKKQDLKLALKDINKRLFDKKLELFSLEYPNAERKIKKFKENIRVKSGIRQINLEDTESILNNFKKKINNFIEKIENII